MVCRKDSGVRRVDSSAWTGERDFWAIQVRLELRLIKSWCWDGSCRKLDLYRRCLACRLDICIGRWRFWKSILCDCPSWSFGQIPGMFRLRTAFVNDAPLHLFQFLYVSPVTSLSSMLNLYRGHLLLPFHCAIWGENGSVATIWCLAYRTTMLKAFTSPSEFKLQI
jgi:hypothetical protein